MDERTVKAKSKKKLKKAGWLWIDTSAPTRAYKQMQDAPDWIGIRANHVVFIEFKSETGEPTAGQWKWREKIVPHLGPNVHHYFIYHPDQIPAWMLETVT